jgi:hypothetical protein
VGGRAAVEGSRPWVRGNDCYRGGVEEPAVRAGKEARGVAGNRWPWDIRRGGVEAGGWWGDSDLDLG